MCSKAVVTCCSASSMGGHGPSPVGLRRRPIVSAASNGGPAGDDRRAHPELPADAVIRGRLIVAQVVKPNGKMVEFYLFTTLEEPWEELVELYRRRWDVELDIRSLKQTLRMHSLSSKSPEGAEKELLLATAGYNLVRSVQVAAARQANLKPRQLSFSRVQ